VKNRSTHERVLLIEHPYQTDWKLVSQEKPKERSRDVYRFQLSVPSGQTAKLDVIEELTRQDVRDVSGADEDTLRYHVKNGVASPAVKAALQKAIDLRGRLNETQTEISDENSRLKALIEDQARLRANIRELPQSSAAYKRYLDKFDAQEPEVEKLQAHIKELGRTYQQRRKDFDEYVADLNVE
jgi:DNA repair ATPase RecN